MPKIYEYFGLIFFFNSNDHKPIHIHVKNAEYESKLEFVYNNGKLIDIIVKSVPGKKKLPQQLCSDAIKLATIKETEISDKWLQFYGLKITPKMTKITKKI